MAAVHGFRGEVKLGATVYRATRWSLSLQANPVDVTNFIYYDNAAYATTLKEGEVTMDCIYDTADNPFQVGGISRPGSTGTMRLTFDKTGADSAGFWEFLIRILNMRQTHTVRDVSRYNLTAKIVGQVDITYPNA